MKKVTLNIIYAFIYQFVIVPILGFFTYFIYDKYAYLNIVQESKFFFLLIVVVIAILNIYSIYNIVKAYNLIYKMPMIYYTVIGLLTSLVSLWIKVYYTLLEKVYCYQVDSIECLDYHINNTNIQVISVFIITYYLLFLVLYKMCDKTKKIDKKQ